MECNSYNQNVAVLIEAQCQQLKILNEQLKEQNELLRTRNEQLVEQSELFRTRNEQLEEQNELLRTRNEQLMEQNKPLQIQNDQLMCILDNISEGVTLVDKDGKGIMMNTEARRIFGDMGDARQLGDTMRMNRYYDLLGNPLSREQTPGIQALKGKRIDSVKAILENESGRKIIETSATPILGRSKEVMMIVLSIHDITEQIQLEEQLKESELRYRNLFNNMESAYACYKAITNELGHMIDYEVVDVNTAYEKVTGLHRDQVLGKRASEISLGIFNTSFEWKELFSEIAFGGKSVSCDLFSENSNRWFHTNCFCPKHGYIGNVFNDITARKYHEQEIEEIKQRLVEAQELALMGEWEYDFTTNHACCSDEIYRIHGYEPQSVELTKDMILNSLNPELKDMLLHKDVNFCTAELQEYEYHYMGCNKTGWASVKSKGIYDESGKLVRIRGFLQDITKQKLLEQEAVRAKELAEEASFQKSEYIASMSHELRTPLNVMLGAVQLFGLYLGEDLEVSRDKMLKHVNSMKQNCLRMVRLVNNLIDSTKIDAGFLQLQINNNDIVQVIGEIAGSIVEFAAQKNIKVTYVSQRKSAIVPFDIDSMERIMLNLLSNAIKFTEDGGSISVKVVQRKDTIVISVKDSGIGIPKDMLGMIFERYHQVDRSLTRRQEGSGIGLSLVKSLVEMHGGNIYAKSELGKGSEFFIELPLAADHINESDLATAAPSKNTFRLGERMNVEFADIYL